jgi:histidinol-phosphate/aromatic aminotransferase/cobyric acid decarboxylase-like protein
MTDYEIEMTLQEAQGAFPLGARPVNLSYWNTKSEYQAGLGKILKYDSEQDLFDYHYYLSEGTEKPVALKLGFSDADCENLRIAPLSQSTIAIPTISAFFSRRNLSVGIIRPAYFTVEVCCQDFKVPCTVFDDYEEDINEKLDVQKLLDSDCDAFWFTSPINSMSIYFKLLVIKGIQKLLDAGKIVVLDESLCLNGMELARKFGMQENLIYIYSPHKALGLQGIKFSATVVHKNFYDEIDDIQDYYGGSLNYSCQQGASHFITKNYDQCIAFYKDYYQKNLKIAREIIQKYDFAHVSPETEGHYAMIFLDWPIDDEVFVNSMKNLMKESGYFVFPGIMQDFDTSKRFCFRINLLLNRRDIEKGLNVILEYLKNESEA